jgi:hypothetical protein
MASVDKEKALSDPHDSPMLAVDELDDEDDDSVQLSDDALKWLKKNKGFLERTVALGRKLWDLEEWETLERWSNNHIKKLEEDKKTLQERLSQAMCKQPPNFKDISPSYRKGMDAIEKLVLKECGPDLVLAPVGQEDHVMKRFDLLISCMARKALLDEQFNT